MIAQRVIENMISAFEDALAREEGKSDGKFSRDLIRELVHREPLNPPKKENLLCEAYWELKENASPEMFKAYEFCQGVAVRLHQSIVLKVNRASVVAAVLRTAIAKAKELLKKLPEYGQCNEKQFILANYLRLGKDCTYADLFREFYPGKDDRSKIDSFSKRVKRLLESEGLPRPKMRRGCPPKNTEAKPKPNTQGKST